MPRRCGQPPAVLSAVLSLLAPPLCLTCRAPLGRPGDDLCGDCERALPWLPAGCCERCALPSPCGRCPAAHSAFGRAWAAAAHTGPARGLVLALKLGSQLGAAEAMAARLAARAPEDLVANAIVVPVPATPARSRRRGFDHAALIARDFAAQRDLILIADALRATGAARQLGAGRAARTAGGRLTFAVPRGAAPPVVLLVDDVHTTGATLGACAVALRRAGAEEVRCLTFTRTL